MKAILWHDETMGAEYSIEDIPADLLEKAKQARHDLIEAVADSDDEIMHLYLEGQEPTIEQLKAGIRKATIAMNIFPVLCGSSFKNKGVQTLLDAVVDYLPSPLDIPPIVGSNPDNPEEKLIRKADDSEPFAALGFKIMTDPFVGQLIFIRVYSGQLKTGDSVLNPRTGKTERIGRLLKMHANKREEITEILAGDICAAVGLKNLVTATPSAPTSSPSCSSPSTSPSPSSRLPSSPRPRPTRKRWAWPSPSSRRRIQPSASTPTPTPARPSSPVWASCTSRSSSTA